MHVGTAQQQDQRRVGDVLAGRAACTCAAGGRIDLAHAPQRLHQRDGRRGAGARTARDGGGVEPSAARPREIGAAAAGSPRPRSAARQRTSNSSIAPSTLASEKSSASASVVARQSIKGMARRLTDRRRPSRRLPEADDEVPRARLGRRGLRHERGRRPAGRDRGSDRWQRRITLEVDARVDLPQQAARQKHTFTCGACSTAAGANDSRLDRGERAGAVGVRSAAGRSR